MQSEENKFDEKAKLLKERFEVEAPNTVFFSDTE
jgi:hypothetical protein